MADEMGGYLNLHHPQPGFPEPSGDVQHVGTIGVSARNPSRTFRPRTVPSSETGVTAGDTRSPDRVTRHYWYCGVCHIVREGYAWAHKHDITRLTEEQFGTYVAKAEWRP